MKEGKKNDLRVKKTRRAIRNAFLELAEEKPVEKITVRELADRAEINKATFYNHYETIYDLIDELEQEAIDLIVEHMRSAKSLIEDPRAYVHDLYAALSASSLHLYFNASYRQKEFLNKLNTSLHELAKTEHLDPRDHDREGILIAFIIQGLLGVRHLAPNATAKNIDAIADLVAEGVTSLQKKTDRGPDTAFAQSRV